ncbi:MAG: NTP transferase domain-containing protein [Candidatus Marinimicrobia bacterium]|nr:NTP transferase domain-containing protein [Candidatus Neomarinimicrobiota bacterium]
MNETYHVIIAGGTGTRFWPRSRQKNPKQLLKIFGEESMIRLTFNRLREISPSENILVVASEFLCKNIRKHIPEIPQENYIVEPSAKNTAPAIGLAAINVYHRNSESVMCVYPSDHIILDAEKFKKSIEDGIAMALKKPSLVTMGIHPTYPATGYGYIQCDCEKQESEGKIFKVKTFAEKPPLETAKKFLESGNFLWNSGMFIWKTEILLLAMKTFMPELHESLDAIYDAVGTDKYNIVLDREWEIVRPDSIDYGVLEKAKNVYVLKSDFRWSDLGSWKALFDISEKNPQGNVENGEIISVNSKGSYVYSPNRLTAVVGLKDIVVINLEDTLLVASMEYAEEVKEVVRILQKQDMTEYL